MSKNNNKDKNSNYQKNAKFEENNSKSVSKTATSDEKMKISSIDSSQESAKNNAEKLDDKVNKNSKKPARHKWWLDAIYFIGGTLALGGLATLLGGQMFNFDYYPKPALMPPDWVFPVAWSLIYVAIGVATFLMWRDKQITSKDRKINLVIYFIHMAFNVTWPLFFFRLALPVVGCIWLAIILVVAMITTWRYFVANIASGVIFCVYMLWLIFAFYLNISICLMM